MKNGDVLLPKWLVYMLEKWHKLENGESESTTRQDIGQ